MMFDALFKASALIRNSGIAAANDAVFLVGVDATIAMILLNMSGTDKEKTAFLRSEGLTQFAHVAPGRAVVFEEDGNARCTLEVKGSKKCVEESAQGLHIAMWMQGAREIKVLFAGKPPYYELKRIMLREHRKESRRWRKEYAELLKTDSES